jgi:hypothetical protein
MNAYVYQAALLCEECAGNAQADLIEKGDVESITAAILDNLNSDNWPQGPYAHGGGEADSPQHCDSCGVFLENPLTSDGVEYVRATVLERNDVTTLWQQFYCDSLGQIAWAYV